MKSVIVIEDEDDLREELVDALALENYSVRGVANKGQLYKALLEQPVDIAILDVNLAGEDGNDIAVELRTMSKTRAIGIIMMTGADTRADRTKGLRSGADAYLIKPVDLPELYAQIESLYRRLSGPVAPNTGAAWKYKAHERLLITPSGVAIELTHLEASFIKYLALRPGNPVTRRDIIAGALGAHPNVYDERRLEAMVSRLRKKIQRHRLLGQPIKVAYSLGYVFAEPIELE